MQTYEGIDNDLEDTGTGWQRVINEHMVIRREHLIDGKYLLIRIGKKNMFMLTFEDKTEDKEKINEF